MSNILILDFGSQYTQLIARRIREIGVYCELYPFDCDPKDIQAFNPAGIILSGGPESVTSDNAPQAPSIIFDMSIPILGICYGMQTMATQLGGKVAVSEHQELGAATLKAQHPCLLLNTTNTLDVWMSHGDHVSELPPQFATTATTKYAPIAAMAHQSKPWFGLQFHPEVTHTPQGLEILQRFALDICQCPITWQPTQMIQQATEEAKKLVGDDHVILGLSGGVDSSVVAMLLHQAIGKQLTCIFIDTGLLRKNEATEVIALFQQHLHLNLIHIDAKNRFIDALKGLDEPELKRKTIGRIFIEIFEEESKKIPQAKWLAQGTIYSDVIESAATKHGKAHVIKSHHNVGGLPKEMKLKILEPVRHLFKDEVRKAGLTLGLPHNLLYRHPFPGPGLGVRILGEIKTQYVNILQQADAIFIESLREENLYDQVSQAFAVFLPVKSVGVTGDQRCYDYVIALRAVESIDFMTAHWAELPHSFLRQVSNRIINEVSGVSRVVYDISGKPPATIEWE